MTPVDTPLVAADATGGSVATRSNGSGSGTGGAGTGSDGPGDGEGVEFASPPRLLSGRITPADYPRDAASDRIEASLSTESLVGIDGRVSACRVTVSSGSAALDATTCRLMIERYRYAPARDTQGRAVPDIVPRDHHWSIRR